MESTAAPFEDAEGTAMSGLEERANRLLRLAIKNFERAECAGSPTLAARFRAIGRQYRDTAILMLERPTAITTQASRREHIKV